MAKIYPKFSQAVKPGDARRRYPLLRGLRNFLFNALPFGLIWLAAGWNTCAAALAAFGMMLFCFLRDNYRNNRRLSEMAKKVREQGNA